MYLQKRLRRAISLLTLALVMLHIWPLTIQAQVSSSSWPYKMSISVKKALDNSNASLLSPLFGASVELCLPSYSGVFSKKQTEMIMADFLSNHTHMTYSVDHEETVSGSVITIGKLNHDGNSYRVYVLSQPSGSSQQIKQFRIEEQK